MRMAIGLVALVSASAAQAADQFDLACTGKVAERYRVDIKAGLWCLGDCRDVKQIASVTPTKLLLENVEPKFASDDEHRITIDRTTGAVFRFSRWPRMSRSAFISEGVCKPEPFSGFPAAKF